jgi:gluconokinase
MLVLILEASTSSAKAMVFDSERGVVALENESYAPSVDENGLQDTEGVYLATLRAGRKVAEGRDIAAVSVGGVWHSIAVCDSAMRPVTRTHTWIFTGTSGICRDVRADRRLSADIYNRTGCMPNVTYQPYALKYLAENGLCLREKLFSSQGGYNFYRMTGERLESRNIVSGMGFLNTHSMRYDDFILDYAGIEENQLGPLATYQDCRPLSKECAQELGIESGIPVVPPHSDGSLNQLGNNACSPGLMSFSVGTSAAIRLSTPAPILSDPAATWCYVGVEGWMCGAATAGACNCVNWFKDTVIGNRLGFKELEEGLLGEAETPVYLPFLFGERCPGWQDGRMGSFHELKGNCAAPDLFRGITEGILFNVYQCYRILERLSGTPEQIILSGGILNSPQWTQMAADIWRREISLSQISQASLLGGAALAMFAGGAIANLSGFSFGEMKTISPRPNLGSRYEKKYERYLYWYNKSSA